MTSTVPAEGEILERSSLLSLFTKEWSGCFWVRQGRMLLLYPNREAYARNPTQGSKTIKLTACMHVTDVCAKSYKGYGTLHKMNLTEDIDHGNSVVARFAAYTQEAAELLHANIDCVLDQLRTEEGFTSSKQIEESIVSPKVPKPKWAGMDG